MFYIFYVIVLALAGNKYDLYENEEVDEGEEKELAAELNAIFQHTSAKDSSGVEDLFVKIGEKFLNPNSNTGGNENNKNTDKGNKDSIKLNQKNAGGKKKGCC